jgi:hypothetical protein
MQNRPRCFRAVKFNLDKIASDDIAADVVCKWVVLLEHSLRPHKRRILETLDIMPNSGNMVRVPGYTTEMYCASCEVRTEFIYVM